MRRIYPVPVLLFCLALPLAPGASLIAGGGDLPQVMEEFSRAFGGLQRALNEEDAASLSIRASALRKASRQTAGLRPQQNLEIDEEFYRYLEEVGRISSEIISFAQREKFDSAGAALEGIRSVCVSCHVKFRERNAESGLFPARRNTIAGQVEILKLNGTQRTDRSNAVVFLERVKRGSAVGALPRRNPVVSQKDRLFWPRVLTIVKGTTVEFPNDDTIFHNVFSLSKARPFDLDVYAAGQSKSVRFSRTGLVKVYCNIHPDMASNILVLNNDFFDVTDEKGLFVIPGVPDGSYTLRSWHEFGGETRQQASISGSSLHRVGSSIAIQETRRIIAHKNKFGRPYRRKY